MCFAGNCNCSCPTRSSCMSAFRLPSRLWSRWPESPLKWRRLWVHSREESSIRCCRLCLCTRIILSSRKALLENTFAWRSGQTHSFGATQEPSDPQSFGLQIGSVQFTPFQPEISWHKKHSEVVLPSAQSPVHNPVLSLQGWSTQFPLKDVNN